MRLLCQATHQTGASKAPSQPLHLLLAGAAQGPQADQLNVVDQASHETSSEDVARHEGHPDAEVPRHVRPRPEQVRQAP